MLSGDTFRICEITGTAVFKIVVSNDSIKNATATSHGKSCLLDEDKEVGDVLLKWTPTLTLYFFDMLAETADLAHRVPRYACCM
jgi:hypothetical protein